MSDKTLAWHFTAYPDKLSDGSPRVVGVTEVYAGPLLLCETGLHASIRAIDALFYAPGPYVSLVSCEGVVLGDDKLVCSHRKPLWMVDATETLRWFARECARSVLHLWTMPVPEAVRVWLEEEDLSESARSAVSSAAWSAARSAARSAYSAADNAARSAAWAADNAARSAACSAADSAADSAAWVARSAARSAAYSAAREQQDQMLESLLMELHATR